MVNYIHKCKEYYKFHIHKLFLRVLVITILISMLRQGGYG